MKLNVLKQLIKEEILKEIKVTLRSLTDEDIKAINTLMEYFAEGDSGFDLYEPMYDSYRLNNYEDDDDIFGLAIKHLLKKPGMHVLSDLYDFFKYPPNAPKGAFYVKIDIDRNDQSVTIYMPYIDNKGEYYVGWFDRSGNYYPDADNFDEDGDKIA